jgi:peptidoglycan/xylan/chitin deacetylase (PgdA/CDA1 family)
LKLALKIDVDSLRATREGVPRLLEILRRHEAGATFFFAVGPDHVGGVASLVRALPGPDIGRRCAETMRAVRDAGFEAGVLAWDAAKWRHEAAGADAAWTAHQMGLAITRFEEIFGERPAVHAAPGWTMNRNAWRNTQALAFDYASDTRGTHPFIPVVRAEIVACPQVPTTLRTLEEADVAALLRETTPARHHVFTLRVHPVGTDGIAAFDRLLAGWKSQGYELVRLRELLEEVAVNGLPMHAVAEGPAARQGPEFLPENEPAAA